MKALAYRLVLAGMILILTGACDYPGLPVVPPARPQQPTDTTGQAPVLLPTPTEPVAEYPTNTPLPAQPDFKRQVDNFGAGGAGGDCTDLIRSQNGLNRIDMHFHTLCVFMLPTESPIDLTLVSPDGKSTYTARLRVDLSDQTQMYHPIIWLEPASILSSNAFYYHEPDNPAFMILQIDIIFPAGIPAGEWTAFVTYVVWGDPFTFSGPFSGTGANIEARETPGVSDWNGMISFPFREIALPCRFLQLGYGNISVPVFGTGLAANTEFNVGIYSSFRRSSSNDPLIFRAGQVATSGADGSLSTPVQLTAEPDQEIVYMVFVDDINGETAGGMDCFSLVEK
jgi:hypothetical protein